MSEDVKKGIEELADSVRSIAKRYDLWVNPEGVLNEAADTLVLFQKANADLSTDLAAARAERDEARRKAAEWEKLCEDGASVEIANERRAEAAEAQRDALQRRVDEAARIIGWLLTFARDSGLVGTIFRGRMVRRTEAYIAADAFLSARKDPTHE